ncbi:MAG: ABC-ATPase domain-containing protein [Peptococcaceae bacterium]|nr:ABC-ATPase domain-containing protein [Peptococcaceae bacterium]
MSNHNELRERLARIDGKGYGAYKSIAGTYEFPHFTLFIDNVQSDPFAPPSKIRVRVAQRLAGFPRELFRNRSRRVALEDYLTRQLAGAIRQAGVSPRGTGTSGLVSIDAGGQEILERTSMVVNKDYVEARLKVGLPARGRTVLGRQAITMFNELLPQLVSQTLFYKRLEQGKVKEHVKLAEDQDYLRNLLPGRKLAAFVANGSILPRESGVSDRPLKSKNVVAFRSPPELEVSFDLPNRGRVSGMGVPEGITVIVGGGYHGKSTLLRAIERGVYNHIPGDGRELVITVADAVKIRAEDGRRIEKVDISGFITDLPFGQDTIAFSSENASGSTSQAANIVEALETGTHLLLLDEDTSATNLMIRDGRMQQLVAKENEPITPFIDRVRELYEKFRVSTILVVGSSGDYFDVADRVIMMQNYIPRDVTARAKEITATLGENRQVEIKNKFKKVTARIPLKDSFRLPARGKVKARGLNHIVFGRTTIDLQYVEQLVDASQTNAIAEILKYIGKHYCNNKNRMADIIEMVLEDIDKEGLDVISPFRGQHPGDLALPRKYEIAAAINRFHQLVVRQEGT